MQIIFSKVGYISFTFIGVISTKDQCDGDFKWPTWETPNLLILDVTNVQYVTHVPLIGDKDDCGVALRA